MSNRGTTEDEKIINHQLGKNIKYLRKQKGFTQQRLARVCDVKFQQIQKYESGRNCPHPCALIKLAQFFKVSLDKLCSQTLISDAEQFKNRVKSLEVATVDGVGIPLDGMNAEIDALLNKIQKHSDKFVKDQPLVFKFDKEVDPWL